MFNFNDIYSGYQYETAFSLLFANAEFPLRNSDVELISFLKHFNKKSDNIYLKRFNNEITSDSLISYGKLWTKNDDKSYIIYKCKFVTAIIQYREITQIVRVFIPTTSLIEFRKITDKEAKKNNLEKSKIQFIYKNR